MIDLAGQQVGEGQPLFVIAGPDVIECEELALRHALLRKGLAPRHGVPYVFKCSYDKANRTSGKSFRGPGLIEGLRVLRAGPRGGGRAGAHRRARDGQVGPAAEVVDILQIPAFLCRQTDLVEAVARTGRGVNLKKGQFVAPVDIVHSARKAVEAGNPNVLVTERGAPSATTTWWWTCAASPRCARRASPCASTRPTRCSCPRRARRDGRRAPVRALLARAAVAAGIDALFTEVHEDPDRALCDGPCSLNPQMFEDVVRGVLAIRRALGHEPAV